MTVESMSKVPAAFVSCLVFPSLLVQLFIMSHCTFLCTRGGRETREREKMKKRDHFGVFSNKKLVLLNEGLVAFFLRFNLFL